MLRALSLFALTLSLGFASAAEPAATPPALASSIRSLTPEEYTRSGLQKLTSEELAYLDAALARRQGTERSPSPPRSTTPSSQRPPTKEKIAADFGAEQVAQNKPTHTSEELHTYIEGSVQEFSGRAVFVLANGQIWQQRTPTDVYLPKKLNNPAVTLIRGPFGYKMVIDAADVVVYVKRIQ
jgi:hypothetical protein